MKLTGTILDGVDVSLTIPIVIMYMVDKLGLPSCCSFWGRHTFVMTSHFSYNLY